MTKFTHRREMCARLPTYGYSGCRYDIAVKPQEQGSTVVSTEERRGRGDGWGLNSLSSGGNFYSHIYFIFIFISTVSLILSVAHRV